MFTHIVLFKLKDRSETGVARTQAVLEGMRGRIPQMRDLEVGRDVLHSERSYDLSIITRFDSKEAMLEYQVHPVHKEVIAHMMQYRESSVSIDYEG